MLWALDSRWNVHVRTGITEEMPVGTDWEHVPGRDNPTDIPLSPTQLQLYLSPQPMVPGKTGTEIHVGLFNLRP